MIRRSTRFPSTPHLGIVLVTLFAMGCARDKEPAQSPYVQGQYGGQAASAGGGYSAGGAIGYGVAGTPGVGGAGVALPAGGQSSVPQTGTAGATVQQIDPAAAAIVQPVLNELAKTHAVAGSKPLGSPIVGNFGAGQSLESVVQFQPQKCYSVVATSLPPVTELNVQFAAVTPLPNLAPVLAADSDTGPTAVVGKKPNCYKWAFPVPASVKVVVQVAAGSGLAAAQVYEK
jgi:hypothetical protein